VSPAVPIGHDVEVLAETVRLFTDDDRSVVDPQPIKIRLVVQPETRKLLGCQVVDAKAAEIVNLAAAALRTASSVTQLALIFAMVHPSASEALVRCLQSRFDRPGL
jgi:pyruvate/2-oxoglutarate dehydrogenase complex dihydrolipoamide dehydrogenase (E3) component